MTREEEKAVEDTRAFLEDAVQRGVFNPSREEWRQDRHAEVFPLDLPGQITSPAIVSEEKIAELVAIAESKGGADADSVLHDAAFDLQVGVGESLPAGLKSYTEANPYRRPKAGRPAIMYVERNRLVVEAIKRLAGFTPTRTRGEYRVKPHAYPESGCSIVSHALALLGVRGLTERAIEKIWDRRPKQ